MLTLTGHRPTMKQLRERAESRERARRFGPLALAALLRRAAGALGRGLFGRAVAPPRTPRRPVTGRQPIPWVCPDLLGGLTPVYALTRSEARARFKQRLGLRRRRRLPRGLIVVPAYATLHPALSA